jgi:CBS domain-containing protein
MDRKREVVIELVSRRIDPRRIHIRFAGNSVTFSGATHDLHPDHSGYHAFTRKIVLPPTVDGDDISARARGSLLVVRLAKRPETPNEALAEHLGIRAKVIDLMTSDVLSVAPEMAVSEVAGLLDLIGVGSVPICREDGKVLGILTDRDIAIRVTAKALDPTRTKAQDVMTPDPITCGADDSLIHAERLMADAQVRRLPVVDAKGISRWRRSPGTNSTPGPDTCCGRSRSPERPPRGAGARSPPRPLLPRSGGVQKGKPMLKWNSHPCSPARRAGFQATSPTIAPAGVW